MDRCVNHPDRETPETCDECAQPFCDSCVVSLLGRRLCGACRDLTIRRLAGASTRALWVARAFDVAGLLFSALGAEILTFAHDALAKPQVIPSPPGSPPGTITSVTQLDVVTPQALALAAAAVVVFLPPLLGLRRGRRWAWRWQIAALLFPMALTLGAAALAGMSGLAMLPIAAVGVLLLPNWLGRATREALAVS